QTAFQPSPGGIVEFNITVTNEGNVTLNPTEVIDTLPAGLDYLNANIAPDTVAGGTLTWNNISALAPGASITILLNATANDSVVGCDLNVTNIVNVTGVPPNGDNATAGDTVDVYLACANVSVLKLEQSAFQPSPGGIVEFNITVTNEGNVTLNPTEVIDTLPAGLDYLNANIVPDTVAGGTLTWNNVSALAPGASITILLNATANDSVVGCDLNVTNIV
ncbi:MAG: DUF11 domain-containing protein, partial [Deltaproteobacteria bacterium]|nr:DUF11 domain-containing protein [Deltaproteobacteria bacterium]